MSKEEEDAKRNALIERCHFYKGEENNPYEEIDLDMGMLWFYERTWVNQTLMIFGDDDKKEITTDFSFVDEYMSLGLHDFQQSDNVPISLKALLFNRYSKNSYSIEDAVEDFKAFYLKYYGEN